MLVSNQNIFCMATHYDINTVLVIDLVWLMQFSKPVAIFVFALSLQTTRVRELNINYFNTLNSTIFKTVFSRWHFQIVHSFPEVYYISICCHFQWLSGPAEASHNLMQVYQWLLEHQKCKLCQKRKTRKDTTHTKMKTDMEVVCQATFSTWMWKSLDIRKEVFLKTLIHGHGNRTKKQHQFYKCDLCYLRTFKSTSKFKSLPPTVPILCLFGWGLVGEDQGPVSWKVSNLSQSQGESQIQISIFGLIWVRITQRVDQLRLHLSPLLYNHTYNHKQK